MTTRGSDKSVENYVKYKYYGCAVCSMTIFTHLELALLLGVFGELLFSGILVLILIFILRLSFFLAILLPIFAFFTIFTFLAIFAFFYFFVFGFLFFFLFRFLFLWWRLRFRRAATAACAL